MSYLRTQVACSTLALVFASHAALAAPTGSDLEVARRVVNYADLNIENATGAAALYARISIAAREVCEPRIWTGQLTIDREASHCRHSAIERAVSDVNAPALTDYHMKKSRPAGVRE